MKDFTRPKPEGTKPSFIEFKIDDDVFQAYPRVGAGIIDDAIDLRDFGDLLKIDPKQATQEQLIQLTQANAAYTARLALFLERVLTEESVQRYTERLLSVENPIDKPTSQEVVRYLIEQYSKPHPTEPPSPYTNGQGGITENSTATVSTNT